MLRNVFLSSLAVALLASGLQAQTPVKDPAELFPPDTLFYAELVKPAEVAQELAGYMKGSVIDDLPAYLAKLREKQGDNMFFGLGMSTMFFSPEAINEVKRFQGGAVAMTGWKDNQPEIVGFVLAGESNVPNFVLRTILCEANVRSAGTVEGVTLYTEYPRVFRKFTPNGVPQPAPAPANEKETACYANMPGMIVIGSSKSAVADVITRLKGKEQKQSLAGVAGFKEAAELRSKSGLFFYANPRAIVDLVDKDMKRREPDNAVFEAFKEFESLKAFRSAAGKLRIANGHMDLQVQAQLDSKENSLLLDVLASGKVSPSAFQTVPKDASLAVSLALANGDKTWPKLLAAADTMFKAAGGPGATPSEMAKDLEEKLKTSLAKDIFGKLTGITVMRPSSVELPKGGTEMPMFVLHAADADSAKKMEETIPGLMSFALGDMVDPITETVQGQKVRSLPGNNLPWRTPLCYGRNGSTIVVGQDRKVVALALKGELSTSLLNDPKMADALKGHDQSSVLGIWNWGATLPELMSEPTVVRKDFGPGGGAPAPKPDEGPTKERKAFIESMKSVPPLAVSLSRQENQLRLQVRVPDARAATPKFINALFDYGISQTRQYNQFENVAPVPAAPIQKK
ncbi:MAG TPA: hypothetical protein VKS79_02230 [Gemmataceae bacterium]|nr:hypothetical protein [Gemmataceae bacterium]